MSKIICELTKKKMQKEKPGKFRELVKDAEYFCIECGRVSKKKGLPL
jgi:hypothetical protein